MEHRAKVRARRAELPELLRQYPLQCAPLGEWQPALHALVPTNVHEAMRATMLLCRRLQLPRYVALLIASYVCTEGDEWEKAK